MSELPGRLLHVDHGASTERGATSVEYALMIAMIAVVIVPAVIGFGTFVAALFNVQFP